MKKGLRLLAAGMTLALGMTALAGCGGSGDTANTDGSADSGSGKSELVMGTNAAFVPFEFVTSNGLVGEFDGVDVAIAQKIAEKAGKTLKIEDMEFDGLVAAVSTGKVDFAAAGMSITEDRKQNVDFSVPYYTATQVMIVSADDAEITSAQNIADGTKSVGVVLGYTGDNIVTKDLKVPEDKIVRANRAIDIAQDVVNGKLDAVVMDKTTGEEIAKKYGLKVVEDAEAFESEEYAIAVKKGNSELLKTINSVLTEMMDNGEIQQLVDKYSEKDDAE